MRTKLMLAGVLVLATVLSVQGQTFGEISGQVRDSSGAAIPAVQVTATNVATNVSRTAITNESGLYSFPAIVPGIYNLKTEKTGFKATVKSGIEIQVQQSARIDFDLQVGQVNETVEVSAAAQLLSTENATVGTVIDNKRIVELPLNGRNYLQLVSLSPNVSYGFGNAGQAGSRQGGDRANQNISVGGQRSYFNYFTLDGVNNTDPNFNTYVIQPSIDALQEFKVQTGIYPAEFGRQATQINVSTKPGTNNYHGTLFEFLRNDKLDAKQLRVHHGPATEGPVQVEPVRLHPGRTGVDSEALQRKRTSCSSWRTTKPSGSAAEFQALYDLPSAAMRNGDFSELLARGIAIYDPATRVYCREWHDHCDAVRRATSSPPTRSTPYSKKLLEFYPMPNLPTHDSDAQPPAVAWAPRQQGPVHPPHGLHGILQVAVVRPL